MIRKNFNITEENQNQLDEIYERTGASESEIMRRAITAWYEKIVQGKKAALKEGKCGMFFRE